MNSGGFHNGPVVDWAKQNIRGRVKVTPLFSSRVGMILIFALVFCVPLAFFAVGVFELFLGVKDRATLTAPFGCGVVLLFPAALIAVLGMYVRRGFAKWIDAEGVSAAFGQKFPWAKLYYVDHVTKHMRVGRVSRRVKDNQLELVFEGGKVIIPPLIHGRAMVWDLINRIPVEVRDDGVPRKPRVPDINGTPIRTEEDLMAYLQSLPKPRSSGEQ